MDHPEDERLGYWVYTVCASGLLVSVIVFVLVTSQPSHVFYH
jgi:hypothetical protein